MQKLQQSLENRIIAGLETDDQRALEKVQPEMPRAAAEVGLPTREEQFGQIEALEAKYHRKKRNESVIRGLGRGSVLASILAAGVLMGFSESEKKDVNMRIATDLIAFGTSIVLSASAYCAADTQKSKATQIAEKAILISHELRIDPPYWATD